MGDERIDKVVPDFTGPLPEYLPDGPGASRRRSRILLVLLALVCLYEVGLEVSSVKYLSRPNPGFRFYHMAMEPNVRAEPLTRAGEDASDGLNEPISLIQANGKEITGLGQYGFIHGQHHYLNTGLGQQNRLMLRDRDGQTRQVTIPVEYPLLRVAIRHTYITLIFKAVGIFYFLITLLVWWLRPEDRAATPLLLLGIVALVNLSSPLSLTAEGLPALAFSMAVMPMWGLAGANLAIQFVGAATRPRVKKFFRVLVGLILFTSAAIFLSLPATLAGNSYAGVVLGYSLLVSGIEMVCCVLFMGPVAWSATRVGNHQALRHRGRFLAIASLVSFMVPSLSILLQSVGVRFEGIDLVVVGFLALFPSLTGYAIVRHSMFDLRRVIRRGAVYAALTLLVSLAYVGVVLLGLHIAASRSPSPVFMGFSVAAMMIIFGLLQVRVLKVVDRFVYRTRYVYSRALSRASEALSRERDLDGIRETVRGALVDAMGLSRVYLAVWEDEKRGRLKCHFVGGQGDTRAQAAHPFPGRLEVGRVAPLTRALTTRVMATTHDSTAVAAQSTGPGAEKKGCEGRSEATFWSHHGIEAVIPLTTGRASTWPRVVGFLLLGAKRADLTLDPEDHEMLNTLGHQISMAVEHVESLEEIRWLNEGLERQVQERTRELSSTLDQLKETQRQLVEAGMQSAVGRLVAALLHEVNTPLGTMLSSVDMVERMLNRARGVLERAPEEGLRADDPELRKALRALRETDRISEVLTSSGERIREVLDSLRRFVSLDAAEVRVLDLEQSVRDAVELLSPTLTGRVKVTVTFSEEIRVRCYPARLNRVFLNLLANAADAIPGEGEIHVDAERQDEQAVIVVKDTGRGIKPDLLEHLFELGFTTRADGRVAMRLGLPSSKRWVEELGGHLEVQSEPGQGTRVRLELPLLPDLPLPS